MTRTPTSDGAELGIAPLGAAGSEVLTLRSPSKTATWLFASGLALSGLLSGTATTAPIAEPEVRFIGDRTSTGRLMDSGASGGMPATRTNDDQASVSRVRSDVESVGAPPGVTGTERTVQAAEVRWLHECSGLTWEQLGRMFGVSRRAVHLWANGGRMNSANAELLAELATLVRGLSGGPDERRALLLASKVDGSSAIDRIRARHGSDARDVSGNPFRPEELLGARLDNTAQ